MDTNQTKTAPQLALGVLYSLGAVGVFVVCSIIQGIGGSSMFSTTYQQPDSMLLDSLMNVTFYPGWLMTAALALSAVKAFAAK